MSVMPIYNPRNLAFFAGFAALMLFRGFFPGLVTISDKLTPALFCSTYCVYSEQKNTNVGSQDLLNLWKAGFYLRVGLLYSGPCFWRHSVFCFKEKEKGESLRGGLKSELSLYLGPFIGYCQVYADRIGYAENYSWTCTDCIGGPTD